MREEVFLERLGFILDCIEGDIEFYNKGDLEIFVFGCYFYIYIEWRGGIFLKEKRMCRNLSFFLRV